MIPIPTDADTNTRSAFENIENRLAALEAEQGVVILPPEDDEVEISDPDQEIDGDLVINGDLTVDGDITMPALHEGLFHLIPSGEAGTSSAQRTFNMHGSLAIAPGGLSAESVRCRRLWHSPDAAWAVRTGDQTIGNAAWEPMKWNVWYGSGKSYIGDANGPGATAATSTRIYFQTAGFWIITAGCRFDADGSGTGTRAIAIKLNGDTFHTRNNVNDTPDAATDLPVCWSGWVEEDEYAEIMVYQSSGGNLNVDSASRPHAGACRLGGM